MAGVVALPMAGVVELSTGPADADQWDRARERRPNRQIVEARGRYTELFGKPPQGMWPSEGSVSPEVLMQMILSRVFNLYKFFTPVNPNTSYFKIL
jgi:hypothetical protein